MWAIITSGLGRHHRRKYEKLRSTKRVAVKFIALAQFLLLILACLYIDPTRGGTHSGGEVEMDERRLDRDESTDFVYTQGGDWGQGTRHTDLHLPDAGFFVIGVFLLE